MIAWRLAADQLVAKFLYVRSDKKRNSSKLFKRQLPAGIGGGIIGAQPVSVKHGVCRGVVKQLLKLAQLRRDQLIVIPPLAALKLI